MTPDTIKARKGAEKMDTGKGLVFKGKNEGYCRKCGQMNILNTTGYCEACWLPAIKATSNKSTLKSDTRRFLTDAGYLQEYQDAADGVEGKIALVDKIFHDLFPKLVDSNKGK
jgi:ribosomal protein L37E